MTNPELLIVAVMSVLAIVLSMVSERRGRWLRDLEIRELAAAADHPAVYEFVRIINLSRSEARTELAAFHPSLQRLRRVDGKEAGE